MNASNTRNRAFVAGVIAAVVAVLGGLWAISDFYVGTKLANWTQYSSPFWIYFFWPLIITACLVVGAVSLYRNKISVQPPVTRSRNWHTTEREVPAVATKRAGKYIGLFVGFVLLALSSSFFTYDGFRTVNRSGYDALAQYSTNVAETTGARPTYEARLNLPQARILIRRNMNGIVGDLGDVTYVANGTTPAYCAVVERDGTLGRRFTKSVLCLDPVTGKVARADFDGNVGTPTGMWSSKLGDQVASIERGLVFENEDVYGYITDENKARLVVPVTAPSGYGAAPYAVAAGVVVFDEDGARKLHRRLTAGEIPGPVMPMHVAAQVRAALNTREGFVAWKRPNRNPNALEDTSSVGEGVATDPNAENATEFVLLREDGRLVFVTPLTPRGTGQNVIAYLEVYADTIDEGEMPEATLFRVNAPEAAMPTIAQRVTTLYDADIDWMDMNSETDASNKARIYEITPTAPGQVVLTIGTGDAPLYRVRIDAVLDDSNNFGEICVYSFREDRKIRCDTATSEPTSIGSLRGIANGNTTTGSGSPAIVDGIDMSAIPTEDLIAELGRRYPATETSKENNSDEDTSDATSSDG